MFIAFRRKELLFFIAREENKSFPFLFRGFFASPFFLLSLRSKHSSDTPLRHVNRKMPKMAFTCLTIELVNRLTVYATTLILPLTFVDAIRKKASAETLILSLTPSKKANATTLILTLTLQRLKY